MNEFGSGIVVNIISSILWVLGGALLIKLYIVFNTRRETLFNRFAQMPYRIKMVHITYGLVGAEADARTAKEGDVSAICSALSMVLDKFGTKKVTILSPTAALSEFGSIDNLISVSGPVWNPITRTLLNESPFPISFIENDGEDVLIDEVNETPIIYETLRENNIPRECYAIVYRGFREASADDEKRHFVVAAGISPLGTYGAVTWLRKCSTQPLKKDRFIKRLKKDEHVMFILKIRDSSPAGFQAYSAGPNTPGFLTIETIAKYNASEINC